MPPLVPAAPRGLCDHVAVEESVKHLQVRLEDGRDLAYSDIGKAHWPCEAFFADQRIASILAPARAKAFRQGVIGYAHDIVIQGRRVVPQPGARTVAGKDI